MVGAGGFIAHHIHSLQTVHQLPITVTVATNNLRCLDASEHQIKVCRNDKAKADHFRVTDAA